VRRNVGGREGKKRLPPGPRQRRVLVTGAGSGATNNLVRSLRAGDPSLWIAGCHSDPFFLRKSSADQNYLLPARHHRAFARALRYVVERAKIDVVIPTTDDDVRLLGDLRDELEGRVFLPCAKTIARCQDKYALIETLHDRGVPVPATGAVTGLGMVEELFRRLGPAPSLWCRARHGTGSAAAIPVTTPAQARAWMSYWEEMRGVPITAFTLSEYLPGRDYACQTLWDAGTPILAKTSERLSYFGGRNTPSGTSSIGGLHKTVNVPRVVETSLAAVRAVDPTASGAFSVDLREDAAGRPCVTEINVGRFLTGTPIFDLTGRHNMSLTYVRLALKERVDIEHVYDVVEDYYMIRDLDALPDVFHADSLNDGVEDVRVMAAGQRA
jgi:carbamoylphosphate synthase large subunit